jgi:hypothetical protein
LHVFQPTQRKATWWLAAIVGFALALSLAIPSIGHAEEANPNNYSCLGNLTAGKPEAGSEEQQVQYSFYCNGPITGYQLQAQIPVTGIQSPPLLVSNLQPAVPLTDTFSCSGEVPGFTLNCVGGAKAGYEAITGQFAIGTKLCAEPRVDPLLTVTYAYLEKGVVTQAISGPFDLGRPKGCHPDAFSGSSRLSLTPVKLAGKGKSKGKKGKQGHGGKQRASHHASKKKS